MTVENCEVTGRDPLFCLPQLLAVRLPSEKNYFFKSCSRTSHDQICLIYWRNQFLSWKEIHCKKRKSTKQMRRKRRGPPLELYIWSGRPDKKRCVVVTVLRRSVHWSLSFQVHPASRMDRTATIRHRSSSRSSNRATLVSPLPHTCLTLSTNISNRALGRVSAHSAPTNFHPLTD